MGRNKIQFQKGMSLMAFLEMYGSEEQCRQALFKWRWPEGFICPECGYHNGCEIKSRHVYQCYRCHHQTSLTAGTIYDSTRLPLKTWFLAMFILIQSNNGISTMELMRQLGISYNATWRLRHKLMELMYVRNADKKLKGHIEMDDSYVGGEHSGGKRGRGASGKTPFVAAVEKNLEDRPVFLKLARVQTFSTQELKSFSIENLTPGSHVVTDGLQCFSAVRHAGCTHDVKRVGSSKRAVREPSFHWVNTILGNLKNSLRGTFHAISEKYVHRYLAEFQYRFNRRFDLSTLFVRLACVAARSLPRPERILLMAEL